MLVALFFINCAKIMLFFPNYAPFSKLCSLKKLQISPKMHFSLVYKKEMQQIHNEIEIRHVVHVTMYTSTRLYSHVAYLRLLYCSITLACK